MTLGKQFLRFAQVGVVGFLVDWGILTGLLWVGTGFFVGRAISYLCAATATWALNRRWTFSSAETAYLWQWAKFLSANAVGGTVNYVASIVLLVSFPSLISTHPIIAVAIGSLCGLGLNFWLSKIFVFHMETPQFTTPSYSFYKKIIRK